MSFLAPALLWLLPLALAPVVIHLLNRMRHRTVRWGAMMFLLAATRESTRHARLRQWLILACRCLALAALVFALARPLVGSWFGGGGPDLVVFVAYGSASMERQVPGQERSLREALLKSARERLAGAGRRARLAVLDSAGPRTPVDAADGSYLDSLASRGPTGTATDVPALLQTAIRWVHEQRAGSTELWLLTDLQRSNLRPDTGNWTALAETIQGLPGGMRLRLLTQPVAHDGNRSLRLLEVNRRERGQGSDLEIALAVIREQDQAELLPVTRGLNGALTEEVWELLGRQSLHRLTIPLEGKEGTGWGELRLPNDANREDNAIFFVYRPVLSLAGVVRAEEAALGRLLGLAVAPAPGKLSRTVQVFGPEGWPLTALAHASLVIWQGAMPDESFSRQLETFAREGGTVLLFPGNEPGPPWLGVRWGDLRSSQGEPARIVRWVESEGPLANTSGGLRLPVDRVEVKQWRPIAGADDAMAWLEDGTVWLGRSPVGRGQVWWCGSVPTKTWSNFGEGPVLVPMVQRLMDSGAGRIERDGMFRCGESSGALVGGTWERVAGDGPAENPGLRPGVWRNGERLVAFNRPDEENDPERLSASDLAEWLAPVPVGWDEAAAERNPKQEIELWRWFVALAAIALVGEAMLTLPSKIVGPSPSVPPAAPKREPEVVA